MKNKEKTIASILIIILLFANLYQFKVARDNAIRSRYMMLSEVMELNYDLSNLKKYRDNKDEETVLILKEAMMFRGINWVDIGILSDSELLTNMYEIYYLVSADKLTDENFNNLVNNFSGIDNKLTEDVSKTRSKKKFNEAVESATYNGKNCVEEINKIFDDAKCTTMIDKVSITNSGLKKIRECIISGDQNKIAKAIGEYYTGDEGWSYGTYYLDCKKIAELSRIENQYLSNNKATVEGLNIIIENLELLEAKFNEANKEGLCSIAKFNDIVNNTKNDGVNCIDLINEVVNK